MSFIDFVDRLQSSGLMEDVTAASRGCGVSLSDLYQPGLRGTGVKWAREEVFKMLRTKYRKSDGEIEVLFNRSRGWMSKQSCK